MAEVSHAEIELTGNAAENEITSDSSTPPCPPGAPRLPARAAPPPRGLLHPAGTAEALPPLLPPRGPGRCPPRHVPAPLPPSPLTPQTAPRRRGPVSAPPRSPPGVRRGRCRPCGCPGAAGEGPERLGCAPGRGRGRRPLHRLSWGRPGRGRATAHRGWEGACPLPSVRARLRRCPGSGASRRRFLGRARATGEGLPAPEPPYSGPGRAGRAARHGRAPGQEPSRERPQCGRRRLVSRAEA